MTKQELLERKEYCIKNNLCFISLNELTNWVLVKYDDFLGELKITPKYLLT